MSSHTVKSSGVIMFKSKSTKMKSSKRITKNSKRLGAITAEVAICLPVLFLLTFGCLELAGANMLKHATESAAYEGSADCCRQNS